MPTLSVFSFESSEVRLISIALSPWWVASDICKILDIGNVSQAIAKLDDNEKLNYTLNISGQGRETLLINESGLYSLVLTSRKAQAKRFKKWLTSEVIPAIRKTGSYSAVAVDLHPLHREMVHIFNLSYKYQMPSHALHFTSCTEVRT
ncbi:BRO-N domain-containing protein [Nostoc sp.]